MVAQGLANRLLTDDEDASRLRKHTWFTQGSVKPTAATTVTLSDGWLQRFGISHQMILNNTAANALLSYQYRQPYEFPG